MEALNVSDTVQRVMARFEPLFANEGYRFDAELEPNQTAQADSRRIEQVLYNLIGNAMNYIGADSTVSVRVKGLKDAVRVEISDRV
jgi:signal transduction histidine kinase